MKTRPAFPHKKTRHLPSKPMKKWNSQWRMMLWTPMAVIGWFACKSLSDWVRYLVTVTCTGKSGIFRGQPVSLRGSNPDYSGRSASRVNITSLELHPIFKSLWWTVDTFTLQPFFSMDCDFVHSLAAPINPCSPPPPPQRERLCHNYGGIWSLNFVNKFGTFHSNVIGVIGNQQNEEGQFTLPSSTLPCSTNNSHRETSSFCF